MKLFIKLYYIFLFFSFILLLRFHSFPSFQNIDYSSVTTIKTSPTSFDTPKPTAEAVIPTLRPTRRPLPTPTPDTSPWGVAEQITEHTWTMKIQADSQMANPQEILTALNEYRYRYGAQVLTWDSKLATYAQSRADFFYQIKNLDEHAGFNNFLEKEDGFNKLAFTYLGENISYGYQLSGVHLIEWIYAGDEPHNRNQLDTKWDHVGIGVRGTATCLIFATGKM
ncbi:MAG: CAP domain-containing protein [Candidatus Shapirobacteria bacterium]|jgi:uncharacterized protein YkwD